MHFTRDSVRRAGFGMVLAAGLAPALPAGAAELTPVEKANQRLVLGFYAELNAADATHSMKEKAAGIIRKYLSPAYLQHSDRGISPSGNETERDQMIDFFQNQPSKPGPASPPPETVAIMADGDEVMLLTSREGPDHHKGYIFNMFRVKDGQLIEHWNTTPGAAKAPQVGAAQGGKPG